MRDLRWIEHTPPAESLASALQSLLATRGNGASYEQLVAALGLGALSIYDRENPDAPGEPARDTQLVRAADAFGLRLRGLHPISAAQRLESSEEFRLHFVDSYVPLILRAFEVGQVALAWNGWPGSERGRWGVLLPGSEGAIRGITSGLPAAEPYAGPSHQVYIVEEIANAASPSPDVVFDLVTAAFRAQANAGWSTNEARLTGRAALEAIRERLKTGDHPAIRANLVALRERRRALMSWLVFALESGILANAAAGHWRDAIGATVERLEVVSIPAIGPRDLAAVVGEIIRSDESLLGSAGSHARSTHGCQGRGAEPAQPTSGRA